MSHAFVNGLAVGAATVALLSNSKKPSYPSTNYPLSKEQAELYMETGEYSHYLAMIVTNSVSYKDESDIFTYFPWVHSITKEVHRPSRNEVRRRMDELRQQFREKHIVILQTRGIDGLPRNTGNWIEIGALEKVCNIVACITLPCMIMALCCHDEDYLQLWARTICVETVEDDPYYSKSFGYVKADVFYQETGKYCKTVKKLAMLKFDYTRFLDKPAKSKGQ